MPRFPLVVLVMAVLVSCGERTGAGDAGSGIEGTVAIGPTCPVEMAESPCADAPYEALITVTDGGEVVATGKSTQDGTFRIDVPPGTYTVTAEPVVADAIAHADPLQDVVVGTGAFTHVGISFDSGIR
jgi:hypothetical protein